MSRFLAVTKTPASWCLLLLVGELVLDAAPPPPNAPAGAAPPVPASPARLSLLEAQRIAFQLNWDLLAAKSGIDLAQAQLLVSKEFPNPNLSWTTMKIDPRG